MCYTQERVIVNAGAMRVRARARSQLTTMLIVAARDDAPKEIQKTSETPRAAGVMRPIGN